MTNFMCLTMVSNVLAKDIVVLVTRTLNVSIFSYVLSIFFIVKYSLELYNPFSK